MLKDSLNLELHKSEKKIKIIVEAERKVKPD